MHTFYSSSNRLRHDEQVHNNYNQDDGGDSDMGEEDEQKTVSLDDNWSILINETFEGMYLESEIENANEILSDPLLSQFLEELRENLEKIMKFADNMKEEDETHQAIQKTTNQYENHDDDDEAFDKAWNERKYLLKRLLHDHIEVIENAIEMTEQDKDEEDGEGEDDEEDEDYNFRFFLYFHFTVF